MPEQYCVRGNKICIMLLEKVAIPVTFRFTHFVKLFSMVAEEQTGTAHLISALQTHTKKLYVAKRSFYLQLYTRWRVAFGQGFKTNLIYMCKSLSLFSEAHAALH